MTTNNTQFSRPSRRSHVKRRGRLVNYNKETETRHGMYNSYIDNTAVNYNKHNETTHGNEHNTCTKYDTDNHERLNKRVSRSVFRKTLHVRRLRRVREP